MRTSGPHDGDIVPAGPELDAIAEHLRSLATAGADEAILVVGPITVESIHTLGAALALLDE